MRSEEFISGIARGGVRDVFIEGDSIGKVRNSAAEIGEKSDTLSFLFPGFIDVHNHGAAGIDVNSADAEGLLEIAKYLAKNGVTAWMPTLVPDTDEAYLRAIRAIDTLMEIQRKLPVAQAVGVHYEGVFANEKMCGALRPEFFKRFTGTELDELPRLKEGVHMMTLAPEVAGGLELIAELRKRGWVVSIGHTKAEKGILDAAFAAGARHFTHFFNAMTGIHHRELGVAGWAIAKADATFDIIADGIHVHPEMLKVACGFKGVDRVTLISDSIAPTGLGDGEYEIWGESIRVENGRTLNTRGSIAGSVITMLDAVMMMRRLGFSRLAIEHMASGNPARLLSLWEKRGSIEKGKRADIVAFDEQGSLQMVMIGGKMVQL
ncbi:MAG TPA: N-acetylglucosamine-6-phosphate deacetylase [Blastocatellia bacterium]|nr:N-acetylglucosamine-6-phosphate deacetylase [Blastocatellia bacterium]